jgi:deazaflavin-dependent oxidoreductase (nitroreductase family)
MRPLTGVMNPLLRKFAGRRHAGFAAQIHHVGRKSGRHYVTPATVRLAGDAAVIALTFGSQSDWSRNVRAAGGCSVRLRGRDYDLTQPELITVAGNQPLIQELFGPAERIFIRALGIRQILRLRVSGPAAQRP